MAAISANLLAAAAPSLSRLLNLAAQTAGTTQPSLVTGFANFLTQATGATTTTTTPGTATTETETDLTDATAATDVSGILAAFGLIPQQLPVQLPASTTDTPAPAPGQSLAAALPLQPAVLYADTSTDGTPSRSVELQLGTVPLAPGSPETTPILTLSGATEAPVEVPIPEPTTTPTPTITHGTSVATTPGELLAAAARPPAVIPQTPVVVDRSQQLPTQPAEVGYGLVGPTVNAPPAVNPVPAVGGTPSQAQVEQLASSLPAVEPTPRPTPTATAKPVQQFSQVLATESAAPVPDTTAPVQQVVNAPAPVVPKATPTVAESTPTGSNTTPPASVPEPAPGAVPVAAFFPTAPAPAITPVFTEPGEPVAAVEVGQPQSSPMPVANPPAEPTPVAMPRVAPSAPPVASQMCDAFVTHARVIESGGTHEFQLRLDPPELGEVKVRVLAMGDRIEARLVVSDDAIKRLIESQLPELRQRLEAAGVNVPNFDVSTDGGGKRADTGGDGWDRSPPERRAGRQFRNADGTPALPRPTRPNAPGGRLDVTA